MIKKANARKWVKFEFKAEPEQKVCVAGTFNKWDPEQMKLKEKITGVYQTSLLIPSGRHEYKFVVNGTWRPDPACADCVPNDLGSHNSVINVG
jgi:1,4-alpha-glucan branching enzyme